MCMSGHENLLWQADALVGQDASVARPFARLVNIMTAAALGPLGTLSTVICAQSTAFSERLAWSEDLSGAILHDFQMRLKH